MPDYMFVAVRKQRLNEFPVLSNEGYRLEFIFCENHILSGVFTWLVVNDVAVFAYDHGGVPVGVDCVSDVLKIAAARLLVKG